MSRQGSAAVLPRGDSLPDQANLIRDLMRKELRRGLGCRSRHSERKGSVSSSLSQEGYQSSRSQSVRSYHSPSSLHHSRSSGRRLHCSHAPSCSSHVLGDSSRSPHVSGGSSRSPPSLSRHSLVASPVHVLRRDTPSATVSRAPPSPPPTFITPLGPPPPRTHLVLALCRALLLASYCHSSRR